MELDEENYRLVRDFVKENPNVSVEVAVAATGVSEEQVREYLRQGRLDAAEFSGEILNCSRCGKPIQTGLYCVLCLNELSDSLKGNSPKTRDKSAKDDEELDPSHFTRHYRNKR
jgi:hypothetical protein